ncbi:CAP10 domain-containing protein [Aphelenchoides besseyi]|nr:CAP10 domain-containing protein [Aphelenchoides besseyi]
MTRKMKLPNLDFLMNLGDWPLSNKNTQLIPFVSWCGSNSTYDLVLPTYEFTNSHKFVVNLDGTVAAYRFPFLLSGDSLTFKQRSPYYEHFYADLIPDLHFIEFTTIDDLVQMVAEWQDRARPDHILAAMHQFWLDKLQPLNLFCYYAKFFEEYSKRSRYSHCSSLWLFGLPLAPNYQRKRNRIIKKIEALRSQCDALREERRQLQSKIVEITNELDVVDSTVDATSESVL